MLHYIPVILLVSLLMNGDVEKPSYDGASPTPSELEIYQLGMGLQVASLAQPSRDRLMPLGPKIRKLKTCPF